MINSSDQDLVALAEEELKEISDKPSNLEQELKFMLLPKDSADDGSAFIEIRGGAGGDEANIFAGDLFRMYSRLAERENWIMEIIDIKHAEQGGLKEVVAKLIGKSVFQGSKNLNLEYIECKGFQRQSHKEEYILQLVLLQYYLKLVRFRM